MRRRDIDCISCSDNGRCLKVRPELASIAKTIEGFGEDYELTKDNLNFLSQKCPQALKVPDEKCWIDWFGGHKTYKIRIAKCIPFSLSEIDELCMECPNRKVCVTINPILARIFKVCQDLDTIYSFPDSLMSLLKKRYPETLRISYNGFFNRPYELERDWLTSSYIKDDLMGTIVSSQLHSNIKHNRYAKETLDLLVLGIRTKYEKMNKLYKHIK
jgi:hypothetical protein